MDLTHIALNSVPPQGLDLDVPDASAWLQPSLREYAMDCRIAEPVAVHALILPQDSGCLIRGNMKGLVLLPCDRCAEDTAFRIDQDFDEYEEYALPAGGEEDAEGVFPSESAVFSEDGALFLNLASLLWEEFSLALPAKPLCRTDCKGLCPVCGRNLNQGPCGCPREEGDPRLSALRQLKMKQ